MIDLCKNKTCVNGYCFFNSSKQEAEFKCFNLYTGENCEVESNDMEIRNKIARISSILAIVIIVSSFGILLLNLLFCLEKNRKKQNQKRIF